MPEQLFTSPQPETYLEHRSTLLSGMLIKTLRRWFSTSDTLPVSLQHLVWTASSNTTKLRIETRDQILGHDWEARPSVVVRENSMVSQRLGIGEGRLSLYRPSGVDWHNTLYVGSHTILCLSPLESESRMMALYVQQNLQRFQHCIRRGIGMLRLRVNEIGNSSLLRESRQTVATPITIGYVFDSPYVVFALGPKIRFIDLNVGTT